MHSKRGLQAPIHMPHTILTACPSCPNLFTLSPTLPVQVSTQTSPPQGDADRYTVLCDIPYLSHQVIKCMSCSSLPNVAWPSQAVSFAREALCLLHAQGSGRAGSQTCTMKLHLPAGRKPGHLHSVALANRKDSLKWKKGAFLTHKKPKLMYNMGGKGRKNE